MTDLDDDLSLSASSYDDSSSVLMAELSSAASGPPPPALENNRIIQIGITNVINDDDEEEGIELEDGNDNYDEKPSPTEGDRNENYLDEEEETRRAQRRSPSKNRLIRKVQSATLRRSSSPATPIQHLIPHLHSAVSLDNLGSSRRWGGINSSALLKPRGKCRSDYELRDLLGEGSLSKVYSALRLDTNEEVALKIIRKSKILHSPSLCRMARDEVKILMRPRIKGHPNIISLYHSFQDSAYLYYVFELAKDGSLGSLIRRLSNFRPCPVIPLDLLRLWMAELLSVLWTLSKEKVVHRDIKPDNILVKDGHIRVIDFNNSLMVTDNLHTADVYAMNSNTGTIPYLSPQRVRLLFQGKLWNIASGGDDEEGSNNNCGNLDFNSSYSAAIEVGSSSSVSNTLCEVDVWSAGCVMYEMLTGRNPFLGPSPESTAEAILQHSPENLKFPLAVGPLARDFCLQMLSVSPVVRCNVIPEKFENLLRHPFFGASFDWHSPLATDGARSVLGKSMIYDFHTYLRVPL